MTKLFYPVIICLTLLFGGCSSVQTQKKTMPDTAAMKDEFTRSYLTSSKEVEKGFYRFKSKTGGYTMLFPVDAVISDGFGNEIHGDYYEAIIYGAERDDAPIMVDSTYENKNITKNTEVNLDLLSSTIGYEGNYQEMKDTKLAIYFAQNSFDVQDTISFNYFAYIKSQHSTQAIQFIYGVSCQKADKKCLSATHTFETTAMKIIKSVNFIHK
ncbi:hypothetical protein CEF21_05825 [Bacillus sp. FJAT-42376]|uniref:hypothetical protein n=1 Tax=Bacillus sp. FJAT-42376 TaxID=2014076 RepID=UPI000F4EF1F6|nr:hypothetical protein [Bacillus sp. FJAT-42376]AZB41860.1 hypothetical protein CEF21_05825 [Bacillus sp. FJAT-42376]